MSPTRTICIALVAGILVQGCVNRTVQGSAVVCWNSPVRDRQAFVGILRAHAQSEGLTLQDRSKDAKAEADSIDKAWRRPLRNENTLVMSLSRWREPYRVVAFGIDTPLRQPLVAFEGNPGKDVEKKNALLAELRRHWPVEVVPDETGAPPGVCGGQTEKKS